MNEELTNHLKVINKRLDKLAKTQFEAEGFTEKTCRLRLLAELVREQSQSQEIEARKKNPQK